MPKSIEAAGDRRGGFRFGIRRWRKIEQGTVAVAFQETVQPALQPVVSIDFPF